MPINFHKYLILASFFLELNLVSFAQNFITNPSFEGPDGIEVIPSDWFAGCGVLNTPDTQPGWWNVENKPQDGKSYIDLLYKDDGTTESVYQKLSKPMPAGGCFLIEIYLAQACQDSISGLYPYSLNHPGDLIIRGSETYACNNGQILAHFEQVSNCKWRKFSAVFQTLTEINYIYLEFSKGSSIFENGSILIDNFKLDFLVPYPEQNLAYAYGQEVLLQSSVEGNYFNWQIGDVFLENDSSFQNLTITENVFVELSYWSEDSCLVIETFMIYVQPTIPNIITPNDHNNVNDIFLITGLVETGELIILNRWGETMYSSPDYQNDWEPQNLVSGVYFYRLFLKESKRYFTGFLTIQ